jgi:cysteine synthase A
LTNTRHKLQGIGYARRAAFWDPSLVDGFLAIADEQAINQARWLARKEGVIAGFSTGANVAAALQVAARLPPEALVVTVACDSGMKYLSTDLYEDHDAVRP